MASDAKRQCNHLSRGDRWQLLVVLILLVCMMCVFTDTGDKNVDTSRALWRQCGLNSG